jgi:hypothetical protein
MPRWSRRTLRVTQPRMFVNRARVVGYDAAAYDGVSLTDSGSGRWHGLHSRRSGSSSS